MKSQYHDKEPKFHVGQKVLVHNEDEICEISQVIDYHSGWRYYFIFPDGTEKRGINGFYESVFTPVKKEKT